MPSYAIRAGKYWLVQGERGWRWRKGVGTGMTPRPDAIRFETREAANAAAQGRGAAGEKPVVVEL